MILYARKLLPLLSGRTRAGLIFGVMLMVCLALLEATAVLLLAPLLSMLTGAQPANSVVVDLARHRLGIIDKELLMLILAICVGSLFLLKNVLAIVVLWWNATLGLRAEAVFAKRMTRMYLSAPYAVHLSRNSSEFQYIINTSLRAIFGQALIAVSAAIGDLCSAFLVALVLVLADPALALLLATYLIIIAAMYRVMVGQKALHVAAKIDLILPKEIRYVNQSMTSAKQIKIAKAQDTFADQVYATRMEVLPAQRTYAFLGATPRYVLELAMLGASVVMAIGAFSTRSPADAAATVALFMAGGLRLLAPMNKVLNGITLAQSVTPALDLVRTDIGNLAKDETLEADSELLEKLERLHIRDLTFSYEEGGPVLQHIDLAVDAGSTVALVGGSGAGKSTLADLMLGVLEPQAGTISINGHPLGAVRNQWQRKIGYVPQTVPLLDDSVRNNVAFGQCAAEINDSQVWQAIAAAQLTSVVQALPDGLHAPIGEGGVRLSGGQRQRLGIARALYHGPQVLFLDEATSALDAVTESQISEVLGALHGDVTIVLIAHRLSTVKHADRIYYMENGRILASGQFDELANVNEGFARLVELSEVAVIR